MTRHVSPAHLLTGALLLLVSVTGCRTYGSYGSEEEIPRQMERAVEQYADDLARARTDLDALSQAAEQNDALAAWVSRYRALVDQHETLLVHHREIAERFQDGGTYRDLHRNYGAIISEQRRTHTRYTELHVRIQRAVTGQPVVVEVPLKNRYVVNPAYYARVQHRRQGVTMQEALQEL